MSGFFKTFAHLRRRNQRQKSRKKSEENGFVVRDWLFKKLGPNPKNQNRGTVIWILKTHTEILWADNLAGENELYWAHNIY